MRPLRYAINVTLDGCCDHQVGNADEESTTTGPTSSDDPTPCSSAG